ncbi:MAG: LLM class flavin-dependent oxidoreductase [Alphaproteobacteria bacterium]|nr:LLM class flavin-dependent oxidoreductase [Alphaproteobacteria bacterium]
MGDRYLKFGIFLAPFHHQGENPTAALQRDLELLQHLDALGWDEAWIGEHHSAGMEIIAAPEIFIAAAAERTKHIRLGTGVVSLPYHHPLIVADRMNFLDHLTRGRAMFGVGPGALVSDAVMLGIRPDDQRRRMDEALEVILPLLRGETVTARSDWFEIAGGRLQLPPYTRPHITMGVACAISPSGPRCAGKHGLPMLSLAATSPAGFGALTGHWDICHEVGASQGYDMQRQDWRLLGMFHIAETRKKAKADVRFGIGAFLEYFDEAATFPVIPADGPRDLDDRIEWMIESGIAVIGDPDDAIKQIERLWQGSGGFGTMMTWAVNWADWVQTKRSYELVARYVFPHFQNSVEPRWTSYRWVCENHARFIAAGQHAVAGARQVYEAEREARAKGAKPGARRKGKSRRAAE